jgi:Phospholipase_D-nuclease N-terminal
VAAELGLVGFIGIVLAYLDVLAVATVVRDENLNTVQRLAWCVTIVFIPVVGAILALRNAAESNSTALPSRLFLMPILPMLRVSRLPPGDAAREDVGIDIALAGGDAIQRDPSVPAGSDHLL